MLVSFHKDMHWLSHVFPSNARSECQYAALIAPEKQKFNCSLVPLPGRRLFYLKNKNIESTGGICETSITQQLRTRTPFTQCLTSIRNRFYKGKASVLETKSRN